MSAVDFKSLKKDFRNSVLNQTLSLNHSDVSFYSQSISKQIIQFLQNHKGRWGIFSPLKSEPQIDWSNILTNLQQSIEFLFPKVDGQNINFYSGVTKWQNSKLGVLEPLDGNEVAQNEIEGFFIPAVAFHPNGYRLGRGLGFYDRALEKSSGHKVGISYQNNILNDVPFENHDICMDYIITDKQILKIQKNIEIGDI